MTGTARIKIKAQLIAGDGEIAFGPGKADLVDAIDRHGSISAAARAMGLSYRRAWLMVDTMNRRFREPLVATGSQGARLTDAGRDVLAAYRRYAAILDRADAGELVARVRD